MLSWYRVFEIQLDKYLERSSRKRKFNQTRDEHLDPRQQLKKARIFSASSDSLALGGPAKVGDPGKEEQKELRLVSNYFLPRWQAVSTFHYSRIGSGGLIGLGWTPADRTQNHCMDTPVPIWCAGSSSKTRWDSVITWQLLHGLQKAIWDGREQLVHWSTCYSMEVSKPGNLLQWIQEGQFSYQ